MSIIIDCGSGNTCQNNIDTACKMVKEIADLAILETVIKWQLFKEAGDNIPLNHEVFERAYRYAAVLGLRTTASVFDKESLDFLLTFGVPFVKIANNQKSRDMLKFIPDAMPIVMSVDSTDEQKFHSRVGISESKQKVNLIYTVSKYPASNKDYDKFGDKLKQGISDHTDNFDLYKKYKPEIYEFHFKLKDSKGNDAGSFARTSKQCEENLK